MTFDAARTHAGYILPWLWKNRGVVIASPTYEGFLVPPVRNLLEIASHKRMFNKTALYTGSFTWGGGAAGISKPMPGSLSGTCSPALITRATPVTMTCKLAATWGQSWPSRCFRIEFLPSQLLTAGLQPAFLQPAYFQQPVELVFCFTVKTVNCNGLPDQIALACIKMPTWAAAIQRKNAMIRIAATVSQAR